jgi:multidrug efflux pump subunit AcrA (membrane-fusion protein)
MEIERTDIRSRELQEVMSEIPGKFLRWGLLMFFGIVVAIVGTSWFISYPDIVVAPVTITTINPPAPLVAKTGGKIEKIFAANGERVKKGGAVALVENNADHGDIRKALSFAEDAERHGEWKNAVTEMTVPTGLSLGTVRGAWTDLAILMEQYGEYLELDQYPVKIGLYEKQLRRQEEYVEELKVQEKLSEEDLRLTANAYWRDSILFNDRSYLSVNEIERSRRDLLQKEMSHAALESSIKNSASTLLQMEETLFDMKVQYEKDIGRYETDLDNALQRLRAAIAEWKSSYLLESPVDGTVTYTGFWSENQVISAGESFATVMPDGAGRVIMKAEVPVSGLGKVRPGMETNIKLSGFPYMEYGAVKGRISTVSAVPVGGAYIADIELVNGMVTTYGRELDYINGMTGTADIITKESRLIYRFIEPLMSVFAN